MANYKDRKLTETMISGGYKNAYQQGFSDALCDFRKELKTGHWVLTQKAKCVDMSCSECGNVRFKDYAHTIEEFNFNDLFAKIRLNYCECCGVRMQKGFFKYANDC